VGEAHPSVILRLMFDKPGRQFIQLRDRVALAFFPLS